MQGSYLNGFAPRDGQPRYQSLWSGCIGAWAPCLGPTGADIRDWSARKYTASSIGTGNAIAAVNGRWAATVNGSGIYGTDTIEHGIGTGDFTVSMWINPSAITSAYKGCFAVGFFAPSVYMTLPGSQWGAYWGANRASGDTLVAGVFSHISVKRKSGVLYFATNGKQSATTHAVALSMSSNSIGIGGERSSSATNAMAGAIDDVMFHDRALTDAEQLILASRRGIAYELAPRRRSSVAVQFNRRRRLLIGAH